MNELEALQARHSVRRYIDEPMSSQHAAALVEAIKAINAEAGLHFQLVLEDPAAFKGSIIGYGLFKNVRNYVALVGPDTPELNQLCGYYGQKLVLRAQMLGLNTCWVGMKNFSRKAKCSVGPGEKLALIIAIGKGETQGKVRKSKPAEKVSNVGLESPQWFACGVEAALLAPTAVNQQKFYVELAGATTDKGLPLVRARSLGGPFSDVDLGIVKYNFEVAAGTDNFAWDPKV